MSNSVLHGSPVEIRTGASCFERKRMAAFPAALPRSRQSLHGPHPDRRRRARSLPSEEWSDFLRVVLRHQADHNKRTLRLFERVIDAVKPGERVATGIQS